MKWTPLLLALSLPTVATANPDDTAAGPAPASSPASMPTSSPASMPATDAAATGAPQCSDDDIARLKTELERHPVVDVARATADGLRAMGRAEAAWSDPSAFVEARGLPLTEPWNMGRTPMGGVSMGVAGKVPWLPKLWALEQAREHEAKAALEGVGERELDLSAALLQLIVQDELLDTQARIHGNRADLLTSLSAVARANSMVGAGGQTDAVLLEAKAARATALIVAIEAQRQALRARWSGIVPEVAWPECRIGDGQQMLVAATSTQDFETRPTLRALEQQRRAAAARRTAALHAWVPEPTLKAAYVWRPDYGNFDGMDFVGGMVSIPLSISPGKRLGALDAAAAASRRVEAQRRAFLLEARGEQQALREALDAEARRLRELEVNARPVAQAAIEVAQSTYAAGRGGVAAIVEAERLVLDLDLAIAEARARQAALRVQLWRVEGGAQTPDR